MKLKPETFFWLALSLLWLYFSFFHGFDDDEFQHCHNAYLIWKGFVPYRDFFEHHLPLYHILFSPLFIFGEKPSTIFAFRLVSLVSSGTVFFLIYRFLKGKYTKDVAVFLTGLLFFVPMYLLKMTEARPESIAMLLFTLVVILIFDGTQETKIVFLAGFLSGLMVCFSLKYIFSWLGLFTGFFVLRSKKSGEIFLGGFLSGIFPLFFYALIKGILPEFIRSTVLLNIRWKYKFSPAGYLYESFVTAGVLMACAISSIIAQIFTSDLKKNAILSLCLVFFCFLGIVVVPVPYRQLYLPLLIICTICAGPVARNLFDIIEEKNIKPIVAGIVWICAISNSLAIIKNEITQTNFADIRKMEKIDAISPGIPVFDGRALMFYRMHTTYYGFMHHELIQMLDPQQYSQHVIGEMIKNNFPVVIYDYRVMQMPAKIQDFIQKHYCCLEDDIYVPGVRIDRAQFSEGKAYFPVNVSGWYRISFSGDDLAIDGKPIKSGSIKFFEKGDHIAETKTFIDGFTIILEKRNEK